MAMEKVDEAEVGDKIAVAIVKYMMTHGALINVPKDLVRDILSLPEIAILHPDQTLPGWNIPLRQFAKTEVYHHAQGRMLEEGWRRVIKEE